MVNKDHDHFSTEEIYVTQFTFAKNLLALLSLYFVFKKLKEIKIKNSEKD